MGGNAGEPGSLNRVRNFVRSAAIYGKIASLEYFFFYKNNQASQADCFY
jgi:hypothetical protein